jgi:hypothetical protein
MLRPTGTSTADTADTVLGPTAASTGETGAHTGVDTQSGPTGLAPTADTADTSEATDTAASTGHTGDTAEPSTPTGDTSTLPSSADTAACTPDVPTVPTDYTDELPPITDTGSPCPADTSATGDTGSLDESCPEVDWVLYTEASSHQYINYLHPLPDGAVFIIGHDLVGGWALAEGRPDEVVLPVHCSTDYLPWMGVVETDGTVRWARRLADTCGTVFAQGSSVSPSGDVLVWGNYLDASYGPTYLTVDPDGPNPVQLPPPCDSCDEDNGWWAQLAPDGTVVQAHSISAIDGSEFPRLMTLGDDGTAFAHGYVSGSVTFNAESSTPVQLHAPSHDRSYPWLVAWEPAGDARFATLLEDSETRAPVPFHLAPLDDGTLRIHATILPDRWLPIVWGACTPFETVYLEQADQRVGYAHYDQLTGVLLDAPIAQPGISWLDITPSSFGLLAVGYGYEPIVHDGRLYPGNDPVVAIVDDYLNLQGIVTAADANNLESPAQQLVAAGDDFIVVAGRVEDNSGGTFAWTCGPDVPAHDAPTASLAAPFMYQAFTPELQPTCGGVFGVDGASGETANGMAADGDGGVMVTFALSEEATFLEGTPEEVTIVPDSTDVLLIRLHTP